MPTSRFTRLFLLALLAGLFYVGHGLHFSADALPPLVSPARADERFHIDPPVPRYPIPRGFKWEALPAAGQEPRAYRAKVPGGWLVATTVDPSGGGASVHTIFVDDVYHWWELK